MSRIDQINELLRGALAEQVNDIIEMPDGLITVTRVKCSPNLKEATVLFSVLPDKLAGTALGKLRKHSQAIMEKSAPRLKLKYLPRLNWRFDPTERRAEELEETIRNIE